MRRPKLTKFDAAELLKTPEARAAFLTEALATGDAKFIEHAIDTAARAKGMSKITARTGRQRVGPAGNKSRLS